MGFLRAFNKQVPTGWEMQEEAEEVTRMAEGEATTHKGVVLV